MKTLAVKWIVSAVSIFLVAQYLPGIEVLDWKSAFLAALVLGFLNLLIRPILFILTLPITLLTLGLFAFILNALMLYLVESIVPGFFVDGLGWTIIAAIIISLVSSIGNTLIMGPDKKIG